MKNLFLSLLILMIGAVSSYACNPCTEMGAVKLSVENSALTTCDSKTEVIIYNSIECDLSFTAISLTNSENYVLDVNYGSVPCGDTSFALGGYEFCTVGVEFIPVTLSGEFPTEFIVENQLETITTDITGAIDSSCLTDCAGSECDGKVTELTLAYYGEDGATVEVFQGKYKDYLKTITETEDKHGKKHHHDKKNRKHHHDKKNKKDGHKTKEAISIFYSNTLISGDEFSFEGVDSKGTLGTTIFILVNGELNAEIHTSCSKPIGPDLIVGDFTVVSGSSLNGGPLVSVTCVVEKPQECTEGNCDGKVIQLTLINNGPARHITVIEPKTGREISNSGYVEAGNSFEFYGHKDDLTMGTWIDIIATADDGSQTTTPIHTSCSVPIGPGAEFGVFEVLSGESLKGGELAGVVCPTNDGTSTTGSTTSTTTTTSTNYLASLNLIRPIGADYAYVLDNTLVFDAYNDLTDVHPMIEFDEVINSSTMMTFNADMVEGRLMLFPRSLTRELVTKNITFSKRYGFIFPNIGLKEMYVKTWSQSTTGIFSNMSLVDYVNTDLLP